VVFASCVRPYGGVAAGIWAILRSIPIDWSGNSGYRSGLRGCEGVSPRFRSGRSNRNKHGGRLPRRQSIQNRTRQPMLWVPPTEPESAIERTRPGAEQRARTTAVAILAQPISARRERSRTVSRLLVQRRPARRERARWDPRHHSPRRPTGRRRIGPHAYDQCVASPTVINEDEFEVARVKAVGGPSGAAVAFNRLEKRMRSLRGRKMYGLLYPGNPDRYFACLRLDSEVSDDLGFERASVPGGLHGRSLVRDWSAKIPELPQLFDSLHAALVGSGYLIDRSRPSIEYYRRMDALTIMVPVLAVDQVG